MPREKDRSKRKYFAWTPDATKCFVDVWQDNLQSFRGRRKKTLIHRDMSEAMSKFGVTEIEIKAKLQVMRKRYWKEAKIKTGSKWEYFARLKDIIEQEDDFVDVTQDIEYADIHADSRSKKVRFLECNNETYTSSENTDDYCFDSDDISEQLSLSEFEFPLQPLKICRPKIRDKRPRGEEDIEEEKLAVQKESLQVMRLMAKELSNMYTSFLDIYKKSHS